jgi:hypothetical protein
MLACDPHCHQPRRVSGDSLDHSWRRIELKLSVRCSMRSPPPATERVMADFSYVSTKRTSHWPGPMSWEASVRSASLSWSQRLSSPAATPIRRLISRRGRPPESSPPRTTSLQSHQLRTEQHRESRRWWPLKRSGPLAGRNRPKKTGFPTPRASTPGARRSPSSIPRPQQRGCGLVD